MLNKRPSLWTTIKPVMLFSPIIGTAVLLVGMWFVGFYKNPTLKDFIFGFLLFFPSVLIASFFGFIFGIFPAIVAGALKHYLMVQNQIDAFGFTFVWFYIFGLLLSISSLYPLWMDPFLTRFLVLPSFVTGLLYIWLEVWLVKYIFSGKITP